MSGADDLEGEGLKIPKAETLEAGIIDDQPWRLWHMIVLILLAALFLWAWTTIGLWAVVLLVFLAVALGIGWSITAVRGASSQRYALLWMLAIAADHKMPLATTVEAFAGQFRGAYRRRVRRLAARLNQGAPLSHALRSVHGLSSPDANILIEVAEDSGRLGPALRRAASLQAARSTLSQTLASQVVYLLLILLITQVITAFLLYFIVPKFEAIFNDFGVSLPRSTMSVIQLSHLAVRFLVPLWLPLLTLGLILLVPITLSAGTSFESAIVARLFPRRHAAAILRSLAMCVEAGQPMERGLRTLASHYPIASVRRRLNLAWKNVHHGVDWREALRRHALISQADQEVLSAASAVGNLGWAMNDLADAVDRRLSLRVAMLSQAVWPLVIVAIASLVLFLAVGFFAPLVTLIGRLSG